MTHDPMTCAGVDGLIDAFVSGALEGPDADAVEAHLAGCPACREQRRRAERLTALLGDLAPSEVPVRPPFRPEWAAVAAGLAATLLIALMWAMTASRTSDAPSVPRDSAVAPERSEPVQPTRITRTYPCVQPPRRVSPDGIAVQLLKVEDEEALLE